MLNLSLAVNILILAPLLFSFLSAPDGMTPAFGPDTPARRILFCLYSAILLVSVAMLGAALAGRPAPLPAITTLLALQILYKLATVGAVGLSSPVVQVNLGVALLHMVTLAVVFSR